MHRTFNPKFNKGDTVIADGNIATVTDILYPADSDWNGTLSYAVYWKTEEWGTFTEQELVMENTHHSPNQDILQIALKALEFYANGDHQRLLTGFKNGNRIDWDQERKLLEDTGYRFNGDLYDGSEDYVEDGRTAQQAIDTINQLLDKP